MLLASSAAVHAVAFLLRPAAAYEAISLGAPAFMLGTLSAAFALVPLFVALPVGRAVDRFGERRMMLIGAVGVLASSAMYLLGPSSFVTLLVATAFLGAAQLACVVGQQAMVANVTASSRLEAMFGYYTFAAALGQAVGPMFIAILGGTESTPHTPPIFAAAFGLSLLLLVVTFAIRGPAKPDARGSEKPAKGDIGDLLRTRGVPQALVTSAVVLAAVELTLVYLPALGAERGLSASVVGMLLTVRAMASMLSRLILGRLMSWLGRTRLLVGSILLSAAAFAVLPIPMPVAAMTVTVVVLGLGLGVGQPVTMAWLGRVAPEGQRGRAMSVRLGVNRLGQFLIPPILGSVAAGLGASGVLWALAAGVGLTSLMLRRADMGED